MVDQPWKIKYYKDRVICWDNECKFLSTFPDTGMERKINGTKLNDKADTNTDGDLI